MLVIEACAIPSGCFLRDADGEEVCLTAFDFLGGTFFAGIVLHD